MSATINVNKANQTISFGSLADKSYGDPPFTVSAGADSGLPVSFGATGNCTSSGTNGSTITLTGAGSCTVTASQSGNSNYNAATSVQQSFNIGGTAASITLDSSTLNPTYDGTPKTVTATTNPSGLSYSVTYDGSATPPTAAASYTVVATITDPNYTGSVGGTLVISKYQPVLSWSSPADISFGTLLSSSQLDATSDKPGTFAYTPSAGTKLNAGPGQTLSATFTPTDIDNYASGGTVTTTINVNQYSPVLSWSTPADIAYGTSLSSTQLDAQSDSPGTFAYSPAAGTVLSAGTAQALSATFTPTDTSNLVSGGQAQTTINVNQASPNLSWAQPSDIAYGTALSSTQLDASADVPGTFAYIPSAGTVLSLGDGQTLSATFTPTDTTDYTSGQIQTTLNVIQATAGTSPDYTDSNLPDWAIGPFTRYPSNPILTPQGSGFESADVFNPGVLERNGQYQMLYRAQNAQGISTAGYATSTDGYHFTRYSGNPVISNSYSNEGCGVEDPRLYELNGTYYSFFTGVHGPCGNGFDINEATSTDGIHWNQLGPVETNNKDAAVITDGSDQPVMIDGHFVMYYGQNGNGTFIAYSTDMIHWTAGQSIDLHLPSSWSPYEVCVAVTNYQSVSGGPVNHNIVLFVAGTLMANSRWFYAISEEEFSGADPTQELSQLSAPS